MTIVSTTVGKNSLQEMESKKPSESKKESEMQYLGTISKMTEMIEVHFQDKPFNITVIQFYAPTTDDEPEADQFYEDLQHLLKLTPKKERCPFHHRGLECKSTISRDTQSNRQVWTWSKK